MLPYAFRKITKARWRICEDASDRAAIDCGSELGADILRDVETQSNCLSLFPIDETRERISSVVAAISATRAFLDKLDYVLFSTELLDQLGIQMRESVGETKHTHVDQWHINLEKLTLDQLTSLVICICQSPVTEIQRATKDDVARGINTALKDNLIQSVDVKAQLLDSLTEYNRQSPSPGAT